MSHTVLGFKWGSTTYAECLEARDALEPLICRHAARYHRETDIRALNKLVRKMEGQTTDPASFFETNWSLHRRIARLCKNTLLRSIYLTLIDFLETTQRAAEFADFDGRVAWEAHRELVAAIDGGEGPRLARALAQHRPTQVPAQ
jgi:DNA-binding FadR family transcriptional regulator